MLCDVIQRLAIVVEDKRERANTPSVVSPLALARARARTLLSVLSRIARMREYTISSVLFDVLPRALLAPGAIRVTKQLPLGCLILIIGVERVIL